MPYEFRRAGCVGRPGIWRAPSPRGRVRALTVMADDARCVAVIPAVERVNHRVINTLLLDLRAGPAGLQEAVDWLTSHNPKLGHDQPWKALRDLAHVESRARFFRLGTGQGAWRLAAQLRAFEAMIQRVADRLVIDVYWLRGALQRGMSEAEASAILIERHRRVLVGELPLVWELLERFYHQGATEDFMGVPTRDDWDRSPPSLVRHDKGSRLKPLAQRGSGGGFPRP